MDRSFAAKGLAVGIAPRQPVARQALVCKLGPKLMQKRRIARELGGAIIGPLFSALVVMIRELIAGEVLMPESVWIVLGIRLPAKLPSPVGQKIPNRVTPWLVENVVEPGNSWQCRTLRRSEFVR